MACENNCIQEHRIKTLEEDFKAFKEKSSRDHKEFYERLERGEREDIASKIDREHMKVTLDEMNENIKSLMQQPAKRYETIVVSVITTIVGAIVGFLMSGILAI